MDRLLRHLLTLLIDLCHLFVKINTYGTEAIRHNEAYISSVPSMRLGFFFGLGLLERESLSGRSWFDIVFGIFSVLDNRLQLMKGGPLK